MTDEAPVADATPDVAASAEPPKVRRVELALQGGGSHGAFTWGVLDRLLEEESIEIAGVSGTSAGAMNAVLLAYGLQKGRKHAQAVLHDFWRANSNAAMLSPFQRTPLDMMMGRWSLEWSPTYHFFDQLGRTFSPYTLNPFDINPLRYVLLDAIDFEVLRNSASPKLFIAATNVHTGQVRVFRNAEMTVEMILASACLPFLFQAVEIEGEAYWDGGYMGNPVLYPLIIETDVNDLMIVQINPFYREDIPRTARDILDRLNEITFNSSLIKELRSISIAKVLFDQEGMDMMKVRDRLRLHMIEVAEEMKKLDTSSKLIAEWSFLTYLRDLGRASAEAWLQAHNHQLGVESSFDISYLTPENMERFKM